MSHALSASNTKFVVGLLRQFASLIPLKRDLLRRWSETRRDERATLNRGCKRGATHESFAFASHAQPNSEGTLRSKVAKRNCPARRGSRSWVHCFIAPHLQPLFKVARSVRFALDPTSASKPATNLVFGALYDPAASMVIKSNLTRGSYGGG